jgi:hypothetical protein
MSVQPWDPSELAGLEGPRPLPDDEDVEEPPVATWPEPIALPVDDGDLVSINGPSASAPGIDGVDLLALDLPPLRMIVPDWLPEGTTIIASPPKVGKSCLVYQVVTEVSLGGELFGRRVEPGSCLYLALEDGKRRGQDRLRTALAGRTLPRGRLEIRWSAPLIGAGLEDQVARWLDSHADAAVVAIDTLQRVRPRTSGRRNAYEVDVEDLAKLQDLFRDRRVALAIVHHSHKATDDDFLASVSGTYGITGSVDTIAVVRRKRLEAFGTITVTGRDIPEAELSVRFDGLLWSEAPRSLPEASFERAEVFRVIEEDGPIFPAAIAKKIGGERTNVQHMVSGLVETGAVVRTAKGYAPTLARARAGNPLHSTHSESEYSEWGVKRDTAPATVSCADYAAHQLKHFQDGEGWHCPICSGVTA